MKSFKFSLNALAALCCLALFTMGCQEDIPEHALEPTAEAANVAEAKQLLLDKAGDASLDKFTTTPNINARTTEEEALVYEVTLNVFDLDASGAGSGRPGDLQTTVSGTLTLTLDEAESDEAIQLYRGTFIYDEPIGGFIGSRALAVVVGSSDILLLPNPVGDGRLVFLEFALGEDFATQRRGVRAENEQGEDVIITIEADFVEEVVVDEDDADLVYELSVAVLERVVVDSDGIFVSTRLDTINVLEGTLALTIEERSNVRVAGTFTYTTATGETGQARVEGAKSPDEPSVLVDILDIPTSGINEISIIDLPVSGEEEFSLRAFGEDDNGDSFDEVRVRGTLVENPA